MFVFSINVQLKECVFKMNLAAWTQKTLQKLGEANKPLYAVMAVALFKGIFRPMFTMMDKESDPETKKYAAVREGATELTALVTYPLLSKLTEMLAPQFSPSGKTVNELLKNTKSTLGFFGVCFAAVFAIPKLCNIFMPHIMKAFGMDKHSKEKKQSMEAVSNEKWDVVSPVSQNDAKISHQYVPVSSPQPYIQAKPLITGNGGMRV